MKNLLIVFFALISIVAKSQCYILFETKQIETASDSYTYNALIGKIVDSGHFGDSTEVCTSFIEFFNIEKDSTRLIENSRVDFIDGHSYRITTIIGPAGATNNKLPYGVMSGLYSTDAATFYTYIYMVGKGNTRNGKPYPFNILPLPQQTYLKKYFNLTDAQALAIWNQISPMLP